jgi:hypothetical protein
MVGSESLVSRQYPSAQAGANKPSNTINRREPVVRGPFVVTVLDIISDRSKG